MYSVEISDFAKRFLKKIPKRDSDIILNKLNSLCANPFPYLKKLKGNKLWRLRILKYRVIVDVVVSRGKIFVLRIGLRKNVYA